MRMIAITIAGLLFAIPASAQTTHFAPGQNQKTPGDAKNINSGSTQRKK